MYLQLSLPDSPIGRANSRPMGLGPKIHLAFGISRRMPSMPGHVPCSQYGLHHEAGMGSPTAGLDDGS